MPTVRVNGVDIYYEDTGDGFPIVWSHEFGGDHRSWEPQVRFFARRYRNITYNNRGYPPSGVPSDPEAYSQDILIEDLYQLLRHLDIEQAHVAGLSMGGNVALNFGIQHPEMCRSLVVAGCGSGSVNPEEWRQAGQAVVDQFLKEGMEAVAEEMALSPTRVQLRRKDPRGWAEFKQGLLDHSAEGSANIYRGVQLRRPTIFALKEKLNQIQVPTLILIGDEDDPCVEPGIFMKREIPSAGLAVFPQSGHCINLEEPALFNQAVLDFFTTVEEGKWPVRG